uniref:G domain-containing protein n=1 Tax=Pyrodinium bahamense TaxID=73915 RepID=A0A7S0B6R5_9DINO|mmetsp:Transcript_52276/g.144773  ORF Transcript_52276/g.144773 Transcript_52276/m.144773 type:complete len:559 (+) Transcript_52276:79-1755(+)
MVASAATAALLQQLAKGALLPLPRRTDSARPSAGASLRRSASVAGRPASFIGSAGGGVAAATPAGHSGAAVTRAGTAAVLAAALSLSRGRAAGFGSTARARGCPTASSLGDAGVARRAVVRSMVGADDEGYLSVREVYRLLKGAPSTTKALRLAARLRRAAREGRVLKDGRTLTVESVDQAMDALLQSVERARGAAEGGQEPTGEESGAEAEAELSGPESAEPEVPEAKGPPPTDTRDAGERLHEEGLWAEEEQGERPTERRRPQVSDVPSEAKATIINNKYNYVDRVWFANDSGGLPRVPSLRDDASLPEDAWLRLPHVAVNGMTNSGKSTLINHCLRWSYAAKASSRPGRTTSIDFYCVNGRFVLVDLPGYPDPDEVAYMGVMKNWESHWEDLVLSYLEMCAAGQYDLRLLLQLQLSKNRPSLMCRRFADEVQRLDLPLLLILTKDDQLKKGHAERNYMMNQIKKALRLEVPHLHYSADAALPSSRKARRQLHRWIRSAVSAGSAAQCRELLRRVWQGRGSDAEAEKLAAPDVAWGARGGATEQNVADEASVSLLP